MIKKIEGIVVSEIDYKESSKIINVLTKEYGIIGFIARGTKQVKSKRSPFLRPCSLKHNKKIKSRS